MIPTKQNLFLFFEENELQPIIDRKLVLLYANRCIIDENAQFEVCGVYELQPVLEPMIKMNKFYASERTSKEANDRDTISDAFEKANSNESNSTDTHFVIGSSYHFEFQVERMKKWIFVELKSHELKTMYITLLCGVRHLLINKEMNKAAYDGKLELVMGPPVRKPIRMRSKCSVNDDFEISISLIQRGIRLEQTIGLFLNPMLTPHQLKMVVTKDESYLRSFRNHLCGFSPDVHQSGLDAYGDSNLKRRFVFCLCWRHSFYLK